MGAGAGAMQPRATGMHKLDSRFHGGYLNARGGGNGGGVYDDPLDSLGGHARRVPANVANEVRAMAAFLPPCCCTLLRALPTGDATSLASHPLHLS